MEFILLLYIIFAFILGTLAFVLKKRHSQFPDFRVGYHNKKIMENKEKWEYANNVAGNLCALFVVIDIIGTTIITFFIYSITTILVILIVPIQLSKK